jgi:hypothetical protein
MKKKCNFLMLIFLIVIQLVGANKLFQFKLMRMEKYKPERGWRSLKVDFSFHLRKKGTAALIKSAVAMEKIDDELYIVDNLQHEISVFLMNGELKTKIGRVGSGPGEFQFPRSLAFYRNKFYFVSNTGIDIFCDDLRYEKRIRPFLNITKIAVFENSIYCNTLDSSLNNYPLIFKLDLNGKIEKYYYDQDIDHSSLKEDKSGNILIFDSMIVFVPINWNQIYFLDKNLNLIKKIELEYNLLKDLESWNKTENIRIKPNVWWFCNMIASAKSFENKIFILLNIPRLEILEISRDGKIDYHYYNDQDFRFMNWIDFAIEKTNNEFCFNVLGHSMGEEKASADFEVYRLTYNVR